jgi:hypothetical protein
MIFYTSMSASFADRATASAKRSPWIQRCGHLGRQAARVDLLPKRGIEAVHKSILTRLCRVPSVLLIAHQKPRRAPVVHRAWCCRGLRPHKSDVHPVVTRTATPAIAHSVSAAASDTALAVAERRDHRQARRNTLGSPQRPQSFAKRQLWTVPERGATPRPGSREARWFVR